MGNLAHTRRRTQPRNTHRSHEKSKDLKMELSTAASSTAAENGQDWQRPRPVIQNGKPVTGTRWPDRPLSDIAGMANGGTRIEPETPAPVTSPSVYIAGPMTGFTDHNYPLFNALAAHLRSHGFTVKNPAENFGGDQARERCEYMQLDLKMLLDAEAIVLMPGWRDSEGSRMEAAVAKALDYKFYEAYPAGEVTGDLATPDAWAVSAISAPASTGTDGIEAEALALVWGRRNQQYGPPALDFTCVGRKWAATLSAHSQTHISDIPPEIVAVMLTDLKTARQARTPEHRDSRVDAVGYQLCLDRIVRGV
jgi:Domain of unknown function (DUF4406)/Domain of unknown function (DUF6378)